MLYVPPGADKAKRVQGVFVSDNEIASVADYWSAASAESVAPDKHDTELEEAVLQAAEVLATELNSDGTSSTDSPTEDPLYQRALLLGAETGELSTSMLQRKLGIGYPRAARVMDQLEDNGVVGPIAQAGKPRPVISLGMGAPESINPRDQDSDLSATITPRPKPPARFDES
jgi:S-DNA-T family DNA segregation ATPase FtsK/SpoIIIE